MVNRYQLNNTNYSATAKQAQAQMQQLLQITQSGNWEQILAILQNGLQSQVANSSQLGGSIFSVTQSVEQAVTGNDEQKAAAFQNILNTMTNLLDNLGTGESAKANKAVKQNDKAINDNETKADNLSQSLDTKLQDIMDKCSSGAKTIEDALKEIEALGGDKGQIATAREELEAQLAIIEENKQILNDGVSNPDAKKQALVNILEAASVINSLVGLVNGYKEQITEQNAIVESTTKEVTDLTVNASEVLSQGITDMAVLMGNDQQLAVQTGELGAKGASDEVAGDTQVVIGEGMTSGPQAIVTGGEGFKYILSGNDKINAGMTLMSGSTQGLAQITQSMGEMGNYIQYFANFANGIGKFSEGFTELVGQYDEVINPSITAIGSWDQVSSANEQLQDYLSEYTSDMGGNSQQQLSQQSGSQQSAPQNINWGVDLGFGSRVNLNDKEQEIQQTDANQMKFKAFEFDTNIFTASN